MATSPVLKPLPAPNNTSKLELQAAMKALESHSKNRTKSIIDPQTFYNSFISLCISNKALREPNCLRSHLACAGHQPDLFLNNQFINLYSKCGEPDMARDAFDGMHHRNLVSWNAMISCYCSNACFIDSLRLFSAMFEIGPMPDYVTLYDCPSSFCWLAGFWTWGAGTCTAHKEWPALVQSRGGGML